MNRSKRTFDIVLAVFGLVVSIPFMLLIALVLYLDSPGPIIFSQKRLGKKGVPFFIHKFRKFPPDWGDKGPGVTTRGDVRMTRFGAFLERTKLDELPQLWNILKGEMSFVGPRPESTRYADSFIGEYERVLDFIPGIFGPNQIAHRNESAMYPSSGDSEQYYREVLFPAKAKADIEYFEHATLLSDIKMIALGLGASIVGSIDWKKTVGLHLSIFLYDFAAIIVAWWLSFVIRFEGEVIRVPEVLNTGIWLIPLVTLPLMVLGGAYRHPLRYFSMADAKRTSFCVLLGLVISQWLIIGFFHRNASAGIALMSLFITQAFILFPRIVRREYFRRKNLSYDHSQDTRIAIYGANRQGASLADFLVNGFSGNKVIGFIDNDEAMRGRYINDIKVRGSQRDAELILNEMRINQLWLATKIHEEERIHLQAIANKLNVEVVDYLDSAEFARFAFEGGVIERQLKILSENHALGKKTKSSKASLVDKNVCFVDNVSPPKRILVVFGTRPEAIKMAPLVKVLQQDKLVETRVCVTGQHRQMLDQVLELFEIMPEYDLNIMRDQQVLGDVVSAILLGLPKVFSEFKPDLVFVHGDTATTLATTLSAYFHQIKVAHVEAGLRTGDLYAPWPEEGNRKLVAAIAEFHFAPTPQSKKNLVSEGVKNNKVIVTGNTVIDSLLMIKSKIQKNPQLQYELDDQSGVGDFDGRIVLITGHRRENFGQGFENICSAIRELAEKHPEVLFIYPVHLNPNVRKPVNSLLSGLNNVRLIEPLDYLPFVNLMMRSYLILTDSGGIQEEAPSLGKPVLVMRDTTERPEAIKAGTCLLVGTEVSRIVQSMSELINDERKYTEMAQSHNPFGNGKACETICESLGLKSEPVEVTLQVEAV